MKNLSFIVLSTLLFFSCSDENFSTNYEVKVGEEFTIELEANWSTGYSWHWTNNSQITLVDTVAREYYQRDSELTGSPGMESWRFIALTPGEDVIQFGYISPGSESSAPVESRSFTVGILE